MAGRQSAEKKSTRKVLFIGFAALLVVVAAATSLYALNVARSFDKGRTVVEHVFPEEAERPPAPEPESEDHHAENILLLGSDTRGTISGDIDEVSGTRADTIMVVHIPAEREDVQVMSIMRDNWVPITGYGHNKINAALAFGGVPLMIATVENFIGARIDHVAVIDFEGFEGLTDALGGVTVDSAYGFSADGFDFALGTNDLNGEEALAFVRQRYAFVDGDYQRVRNQQAYLRGVIDKMLSRDTLTSPSKISGSVAAISPYLIVDEGLKASCLVSLGVDLRGIGDSDIRFFTSPTLGTGTEGTQSVVRPDWDRIEVLRTHFQEDTLEEYEP